MFDTLAGAGDNYSEPMSPKYATADNVGRDEMLDFVRSRHRMVLTTHRADGSLQSSPVTGGVDGEGRIVIASYPQRAKAANIRRFGRASVTVLSDDFNGPYVQVDGEAEVVGLPEAVDALVDYYRSIAGEHPDWAEYRQAMVDQGKCLIRLVPTRWGPVATGGFPPPAGEDPAASL
jgi:PPOX class probable F420-dependent enzyme